MSTDVFKIPLDELTRKFKPAYPGNNWNETLAYLYANEPQLMEDLWGEYVRCGDFREPVNLSPGENEEAPIVLNGTHRVCVLLKHEISEITARYGYSDEPMESYSAKIVLSESETLDENEEDDLFESVRSFRVNDELWVTVDSSWYSSNEWELFLDLPNLNSKSLVENRLKEILEKHFPQRTFTVEIKRFEIE